MRLTQTSADKIRSNEQWRTGVLLAVALLLRAMVVAIVLLKYPAGWFFNRGMEMGLLAHSLLIGHSLASPFGGNTGPTALLAPGYPLLVAATFRTFGSFSAGSAACIMLGHIGANLLTIFLIVRLARRLASNTAALIAAAVWACSPPLLWMPTIFWETSLSTCILLIAVALVLRFRQSTGTRQWLMLGGYCAVAGIINPALLPSLVAIVVWLIGQQPARRRRQAVLALIAFVIAFSPWPIRNARVFHAFIPLRTTAGYELWMGNRPGATGYLDEALFPTFNKTELHDYVARGELGYTRHKSALAVDFIREHPATFARLTTVRIARYWSGSGTRGGSPLFLLHALFTASLGLAGLVQLLRRRQFAVATLFALPLLVFPLPYCITHPEFRYRLVIDPLLTVLAAVPIAAWKKRISQRRGIAFPLRLNSGNSEASCA